MMKAISPKSFKPVYAKDKRRFDPSRPLKRSIGEKSVVHCPRNNALKPILIAHWLSSLKTSPPWGKSWRQKPCEQVKITVAGEDYPTVVVDFQRDPELTVALLAHPVGVKQAWMRWTISKIGLPKCRRNQARLPASVVMDALAWRVFKADASEKLLIFAVCGIMRVLIWPVRLVKAMSLPAMLAQSVIWISGFITTVMSMKTIRCKTASWLCCFDRQYVPVWKATRCCGVIQDEKRRIARSVFPNHGWRKIPLCAGCFAICAASVPYRPNASFASTTVR